MKKIIPTIALLCLLASSCAPRAAIRLVGSREPVAQDEPVAVYELSMPLYSEEELQFLGSVRIDDEGFTVNCRYAQVLALAVDAARKMGGNVVKITNHKYPDLWSTCHRIEADVLYARDLSKLSTTPPN